MSVLHLLSLFAPTPLVLVWHPHAIPALVYLITSFWAGAVAERLAFREYHLPGLRGATSVVFGCLMFWPVYFPLFLHYRGRIHRGTARKPRFLGDPVRDGCLVAGMIILPLICAPTLLLVQFERTRRAITENELRARESLLHYHRAQQLFREAGLAAIQGNTRRSRGYCDDFSVLHYGRTEKGETLDLIEKAFADALPLPHPITHRYGWTSQYHGYVFREDPWVENWDEDFGLIAYPATVFSTGRYIYSIGLDGEIQIRGYGLPVLLERNDSGMEEGALKQPSHGIIVPPQK